MNHFSADAMKTANDPAKPSLLAVAGLRRSFGETVALDSCSFSVRPGEIHAVVGENGSGKSTLIKILSGVVRPEAGTLRWMEQAFAPSTPRAAQAAGVATVFQETLVLPDMSIRDNVMLGLDGVVAPAARSGSETDRVRAGLSEVGLGDIDIERLAGSVSLAKRQLICIARALLRPWRLLILDESTSAIDVEDRDRLFETLHRHRGEDRSILFVSHRMDEIDSLADRATVLRSGRSVATLEFGAFSRDRLLELMSTREGAQAVRRAARPAYVARGAPAISVRGLSVLKGKAPLDLDLHPGEIVGLGGLEGHGQVAFLECVAGLRRPATGGVSAGGAEIRSSRDAARAGVAFLPRDRKSEGVFAPLSILDNVSISALAGFAKAGVLDGARRRSAIADVCRRMKVKMAGLEAPISSLSGGNQQKALLGRLIATGPRVLILNDPMRGVDLNAKSELYDSLAGLARDGVAILLLSTELVELCLLCDRVAVFHDHAVSAVVGREELDERRLIDAMFAHRAEAAALEVTP